MSNGIISVNNVTKHFKIQDNVTVFNKLVNLKNPRLKNTIFALDDISFNVHEGEVLGIIGDNGSGKTTLLRLLSGVYSPDVGTIQIKGIIAPLLQIGLGFRNELIASDNIMMYGMLLGLPKSRIKEKLPEILKFAELERFTTMPLKNYSSGMRMRLGFSVALHIDPDILLVDEILSVGDVGFRQKSFDAFISFKNDDKTIIFTSHNLKLMLDLSDRVLLLDHGKIIKIGEPDDVIKIYQNMKNKSVT